MSIDVVPEDIKLASARMADVAEEVRAAKPADGLKDLRGALPGSLSASAVSGLIDTWTSRFNDWADDASEHREALEKAAIEYQKEDERAAQDAEDLRRSLGLPPPFRPQTSTLPSNIAPSRRS